MLERARALAAEQNLSNVSWKQGDVLPLPFPDGAFSLVTSRFAFHHFLDPKAVLAEMKRVCAPGGRVAVIDTEASPDAAKAAEFNRMEKLRDPSHVRAMPLTELKGLFAPAGLPSPRVSGYRLESDLESLLGRSFPLPGDAARSARSSPPRSATTASVSRWPVTAPASATPTPSPSSSPTSPPPSATITSSPLQA